MIIKRLFLICSLPSFLAGCSEFYGSQPPAPVYGSGSTVYDRTITSLPEPKAPKVIPHEPIDQGATDIVTTKPLKDFAPKAVPIEELKLEPIMPEQKQEQEQEGQVQKQEQQVQKQESLAPEQGDLTTKPESSSAEQEPEKPKLSQEPVVITLPKQEIVAPPPPPPAPPPPPPFEPLDTFAPLSPAVSALALAANQNSKSGNVESATTTIERAIRIEPRNATLYYKLALLRLKQSKPRLAEDLAKKAALLASNDNQLKKHSWLLVARAREMQGDFKGGKEARAKVDNF
jgi:hypothetical protein